MPNYNPYQMPYQQQTAVPLPQSWKNQQLYTQPQSQVQIPSTPVMSIAEVSGRDNAAQFPVGAGVELWLVDKIAKKIYIKNNSTNPSEMQEIDFEYVVKQPNQNEPVSRSEFEEMKGMMAQMMTMMQGNRQNGPSRKERREWKKAGNDEPTDGTND